MNAPHTTGGIAAATHRNTIRLARWTGAWVLTIALSTFGPELVWKGNTSLTIAAILLNLAMGAGMILANKAFLQGLDDLQRKIQLEAMALALGIGLVVGLSYSNLDTTDLIASDAEISILVIIMAVAYMIGIALGHRKYR